MMAIGAVLVLQGPSFPGMDCWEAGLAFAASSAEEPSVKIVQVNAELSHNLDRLERRAAGEEVYDLFPKPKPKPVVPAPSALQPGKSLGKRGGVQPLSSQSDSEGDLVGSGAMPSPPMKVVGIPIPAPVVAPPPPAPVVAPLPPPLPPVPAIAPVAVAPPPPPPKPPAIPFVYMGRLEEGDQTVYFLVKGEKLFMVKAGEDIDEAYSLEGEADHQLRLVYKPLHIAQTLTVGPLR